MFVDTEAMRYYKPEDPYSSPYEPQMGNIVLYRDTRRGLARPESFPAIIVKSYPDDRCDLVVFTSTGIRHIMRVRYAASDDVDNSYGWLPEQVARPIEKTPEPVKVQKPVDNKSKVAQAS